MISICMTGYDHEYYSYELAKCWIALEWIRFPVEYPFAILFLSLSLIFAASDTTANTIALAWEVRLVFAASVV